MNAKTVASSRSCMKLRTHGIFCNTCGASSIVLKSMHFSRTGASSSATKPQPCQEAVTTKECVEFLARAGDAEARSVF